MEEIKVGESDKEKEGEKFIQDNVLAIYHFNYWTDFWLIKRKESFI